MAPTPARPTATPPRDARPRGALRTTPHPAAARPRGTPRTGPLGLTADAAAPPRRGRDAGRPEAGGTGASGTVEIAAADPAVAGVDSGADGRTLAALLPRVRAGDVAAREALARALYDPVRRRVRAEFGRLGEHAVADLTQEAMGRIAAAFPQCRARTDGQLYAWAYRAARSAALNYLAAPRAGADAGARHVALDDGAALGGVADPDAVEELTYRAERGDGLTARGEPALGLVDAGPAARALGSAAAGGASWRTAPHALLQRFAVEAYGELPPPSRELLWRRLVEGAGWEDLGRDLGSSGAAVKRRFERACRRLAHLVTARLVAILGSHAAIPEYLRVHAPPGAGGRSAGRDPAGSGR